MKKQIKQKFNAGFTLIELLVVIAIIGTLATIAVVAVQYAREKAKTARALQEIDQIYKAVTMLANDSNKWPNGQAVNEVNTGADNEICGVDTNGDDCTTSLSDDSSGIVATNGSFNDWSGPYMYAMPMDPWGHEYFFDTDYQINNDDLPCQCDDTFGCIDAVVVGSYGPDGLGKPTAGADAYGCDDIIKIVIK